jgi:hypothetical protein
MNDKIIEEMARAACKASGTRCQMTCHGVCTAPAENLLSEANPLSHMMRAVHGRKMHVNCCPGAES